MTLAGGSIPGRAIIRFPASGRGCRQGRSLRLLVHSTSGRMDARVATVSPALLTGYGQAARPRSSLTDHLGSWTG